MLCEAVTLHCHAERMLGSGVSTLSKERASSSVLLGAWGWPVELHF